MAFYNGFVTISVSFDGEGPPLIKSTFKKTSVAITYFLIVKLFFSNESRYLLVVFNKFNTETVVDDQDNV